MQLHCHLALADTSGNALNPSPHTCLGVTAFGTAQGTSLTVSAAAQTSLLCGTMLWVSATCCVAQEPPRGLGEGHDEVAQAVPL